MKTLELNEMELTNGGCNSHDVLKSMAVGAAWGGLTGGPAGVLLGAWGGAIACLVLHNSVRLEQENLEDLNGGKQILSLP